MKTRILLVLVAAWAMLAQGCAVGIVGAGAAAGTGYAVDRRSTGTLIDDELIEHKARNALRSDASVWEQTHINVTSFNNVVLLSGEAPSEALKQRTGELVKGVQEVRQVHNEVIISAPSALLSRSSDTWITSKVKSSMLAESVMDATRVKVVTENGTVFLMGLVSRAESDQATEIARRVKGVQRVVKLFEYLN